MKRFSHRQRNMKKILFIFVAMLVCGVMNAQSDSIAVNRKKVAVVLSGGGAKGMAHIGVLKVLERAGIPVDIITGTSMGSIIGGLYSIGYNAQALDSMVRKQDWSYVITDKEDLRNQSLSDRQKQNTYGISRGLTIGKRDKSAGGLIKGKNLAELFQHLCMGYTDSLDFNHDLLIPFACVATNIMDNSEVVFHSGRLPQAMRASMAIPAAFSPVRLGDMVLVDGGLKNNYPVDVARDMGADIVIGVTLSGKPKTAEEISGTMSIVGQIIDMNCVNKYEENKAMTDLYMNVDPRDFSTASFTAAAIDSLIRYGEEEAVAHWDEIVALKKRIGVDESFRPVIYHPLRPQVMTEKMCVKAFTFENMTPPAERFLRQKFHLNKIDSIDAELGQELTTSMRIDLFYQTAECRFVPDGDGVNVILSAGNRKSVQLYAGMRYDTEDYAALQLGLAIPFKTAVPIYTDLTVRLGKRMMARGEITFHPSSFTRPTLSYTFLDNDVDVYVKGDIDYNIRYNQSQAEFVPVNFNLRHFNLQGGLRWDYLYYRNKLGSATAQQISLENEHFISYRARLSYNSEDDWYFPTRGARFNGEYAYVTSDFANLNKRADDGTKLGKTTGMSDINANWRISFALNKHLTLQPMIYGRMLFGSFAPRIMANTIGGNWFGRQMEQQMPFVGIGHMEYADEKFVAIQLQAQERIGISHYVLLRLACAQQAEKTANLFDGCPLFGVQAGYYYKTMFGPLGGTFGYSNYTKEPYFFLNLGYEF
ncbi:MAG: patatin-like phospholipase family protein [Bacteroidaceae bacterium]|nr:patatin-like phospholipase family protein [Bacteroidaceae bacterium]